MSQEGLLSNLARVLFKLVVKLHRGLTIHIGFIDLLLALVWRMSQVELTDVLAIGQGVSAFGGF